MMMMMITTIKNCRQIATYLSQQILLVLNTLLESFGLLHGSATHTETSCLGDCIFEWTELAGGNGVGELLADRNLRL